MSESQDIIDLLELQRSADLISKTDLLEAVRADGCRISDRNLTYYSAEGLIPAVCGSAGGRSSTPDLLQHSWCLSSAAESRDSPSKQSAN